MSVVIYIYETDTEVSNYIRESLEKSLNQYDINFLLEDTSFGCSIDIVLNKPDVIISSFDLKGLDGVDSYKFFKRANVPIIYYTKTPNKVYDKFELEYGEIPEDVYCLDRKCSINHMIILSKKLIED
jgi:DNA-binding response OmpR family regulator